MDRYSSPNATAIASSSTPHIVSDSNARVLCARERRLMVFWVGTQAHPEFTSRPTRPSPLFLSFVRAARDRAEGRNPHLPDFVAADAVTDGAAEGADRG